MRILVANPSLQYTRQLVKGFLSNGHEVVLVTNYWFRPERLMEKAVKLFSIKGYKKFQYFSDAAIPGHCVQSPLFFLLWRFWAQCKYRTVEERSFYIDQCQDKWVAKRMSSLLPQIFVGYEKSCLNSFQVAKSLGIYCFLDLSQVHPHHIQGLRNAFPFFQQLTGTEKLFKRIAIQKMAEYEKADTIVALSPFAAETLAAANIVKTKIQVISLGLDKSIFTPLQNRPMAKPIRLVYAGILTERKGICILLEALQHFSGADFECSLAGPAGDAMPIVQAYKGKVPMNWLGPLPPPQLARLFQESHVLVFPSYLDSWAAVVPEAMATGLPVITTASTGASVLVQKNAGWIIPPGNTQALVSTLKEILAHPGSLTEKSLSAAAAVAETTWQEYAQNWQTCILHSQITHV